MDTQGSGPGGGGGGGGGRDEMYEELWRGCAGYMVDVPQHGDSVFYFPQGHLEQLEATTNQELNQRIPQFNLPSKILCRVIDVCLRAEVETDEVYAQITLIPEKDQSEPESLDSCQIQNHQTPKVHSFCKILTASDTSTHGGFSVLRKHANECLPPLDMSQPTPTQELVATDLHGYEWRFKHIFRGQPRRHLLTTGWSTFVTSKRLVAGDAFVFLRGEGGELRVGVRRHARQQSPMPTSVISSQSMHLGVLATARHAVNTCTMFVVYYKPRSCQFIVGVNKYLGAMKHAFSIGMRFNMRFEGDDCPERRFNGTIVGVEDACPQWPGSKWRSLKVQWDEAAALRRPEFVSPWEIEPFNSSVPVNPSTLPALSKAKRSRPSDQALSETTGNFVMSNFWCGSVQTHTNEYRSPRNESNVIWTPTHVRNRLRFDTDGKDESTTFSGYASTVPSRVEVEPEQTEKAGSKKVGSCRLFGIELSNNSYAAPPLEKVTTNCTHNWLSSDKTSEISGFKVDEAEIEKVDLSKDEKQVATDGSQKETQVVQCSQSSTRSRTKVQMQGVAVGRALDLAMLTGYDELISELEKMFDIKEELKTRAKWAVVFTDDEGDKMLVGDDPWPEFCKMVRKIYISASDDVKIVNAKSKLASSSTVEGTSISVQMKLKSEARD
ncbi:hypothetical protein vseg_004524 [Gypsophila vaccaria]